MASGNVSRMTSAISVALHSLLGIFVFGALQLPGLFFARIAKSENVGAIRSVFSVAVARARVFGPMTLLVALVGFWAAYVRGIPLSAGWLIASYVTFALLFVIGVGFHARWEAKILALAQASPLDALSAELKAAIHSPLESVLHWVSIVLWIALFYFMIAKPF